uniref:Transposase n=1 Tax=Paenibacillus polymyxa TaxID=1406 RepID=A0AAE9PRX1_PAEPO
MKTTDARLIHDIKTALHRLDYIQDTHITVDERPIGNRTLHARDWLLQPIVSVAVKPAHRLVGRNQNKSHPMICCLGLSDMVNQFTSQQTAQHVFWICSLKPLATLHSISYI